MSGSPCSHRVVPKCNQCSFYILGSSINAQFEPDHACAERKERLGNILQQRANKGAYAHESNYYCEICAERNFRANRSSLVSYSRDRSNFEGEQNREKTRVAIFRPRKKKNAQSAHELRLIAHGPRFRSKPLKVFVGVRTQFIVSL